MVFSSTEFLFLFLPLVLITYYNPWVKKRAALKNAVLLLASLCFYAWGEPVFVFLMIASIVVTWFLGIKLSERVNRRKTILVIGITLHVFLLFVFKYLSFVTKEIGILLNDVGPIGIMKVKEEFMMMRIL